MGLNISKIFESLFDGPASRRISFEALEERIVLDGAVDDLTSDVTDFEGDVAGMSKAAGVVSPPLATDTAAAWATEMGGDIYYVRAIDPAAWNYNMALYKFDPGVGSSHLLDLPFDGSTGGWSNDVADMFVHNGTLYFVFNNGDGVYGLWEYDAGGNTVSMAADLIPDNDTQVVNRGVEYLYGYLYYAVDDLLTGGGGQADLYRYDFAADEVTFMTDISPWGGSFIVQNLAFDFTTGMNFIVYDAASSSELYCREFNGDVVKVMDLPADAWPNNVDYMEYYNGKIYFPGYDLTDGKELWEYAGGSASLCENLNPAPSQGSSPVAFTAGSGGLYFFADGDGDGLFDLYKYTA